MHVSTGPGERKPAKKNIHEREELENALRQNEARFRAIFHCPGLGIALTDEEGRIVESNQALQRMLGYGEEELRGRPFSQLIHPEDVEADLERYRELVAGWRDHYHAEKRCLHKDGDLVWGRLATSTVDMAEGQRRLVMRMVERLTQPQAVLFQWEKLASIGQLAAGVAHEINNPLGYISSNLSTLTGYVRDLKQYILKVEEARRTLAAAPEGQMGGPLEELEQLWKRLDLDYVLADVEKLIAESVDGSQRVKRIVLDLKTFARADTGEMQLASINAILDSALNIVWNQLKYSCTVNKAYGEVPDILCNPNQLAQVFVNILVNAGQAIEKGKQGCLGIRSYSGPGRILVEISDNGAGIPPQNLEKIFDPFFTTKPAGQGTGLGLSTSYSLVKKHGGQIQVRSQVGVGSSFTVELPVERQAARPLDD